MAHRQNHRGSCVDLDPKSLLTLSRQLQMKVVLLADKAYTSIRLSPEAVNCIEIWVPLSGKPLADDWESKHQHVCRWQN